jgi:hypothetical protein
MSKHLLAILFMSVTVEATAADSIVLHGRSYHSVGAYNNNNVGVGVSYSNYVLGAYRNSENRQSLYIGYRIVLSDYWSVAVAGVTGYNRTTVVPMVMPVIHVPVTETVRLNIGLSPLRDSPSGKAGLLIHTMMEVKFK